MSPFLHLLLGWMLISYLGHHCCFLPSPSSISAARLPIVLPIGVWSLSLLLLPLPSPSMEKTQVECSETTAIPLQSTAWGLLQGSCAPEVS